MVSRVRSNGAEPKTRTPGDFLRRCLRDMARHEEGVLAGDDADAVHDLRVASRRLRAALAFLKKELPAARTRRVSRRVRRITRALGDLRQYDVNARLLDRIILESPEARPAAEFARPVLAADRGRVLMRARKALRRRDLAGLEKQVKDLTLRLDRCDREALSRRATRLATRQAKRLSRIWSTNGAGPGRGANPKDKARLHAIRIATKKLRYHLETGRTVCGWRVEPALQTAREVQELLGGLHDEEALRHWCESHRDEAAGFMGGLIRHLRHREAAAMARIAAMREASHAALIAPWTNP